MGVDELLTPGELEFPVLLDEGEGEDTFVDEGGTIGVRDQVCRLRRGYRDNVMVLCRGTNVHNNFPRRFDHAVDRHLGVVDVSL